MNRKIILLNYIKSAYDLCSLREFESTATFPKPEKGFDPEEKFISEAIEFDGDLREFFKCDETKEKCKALNLHKKFGSWHIQDCFHDEIYKTAKQNYPFTMEDVIDLENRLQKIWNFYDNK